MGASVVFVLGGTWGGLLCKLLPLTLFFNRF